MLEHAWKRLQDNPQPSADNNLYEECFLLHVRVMRDFFIGERSHSDDVLAEDFICDSDRWREVAGELFTFVKTQRRDLNSTLAHLSYKRSTQKRWDLARIYRETREAIELFLKELPSERKEWFAA